MRYDGKAAAKSHGFQAHVGPMRSKSRGSVTLRSPDPMAKPVIRFNYMSHPDDWTEFRHCIRLTREIFAQAAFDPFRGKEISPGSAGAERRGTRRLHPRACRERLSSLRHLQDGPRRRSDGRGRSGCRVIGVEGLRVADSSIFPRVTNGNLNAPSIMTGEKAADHILGRTRLARSNQEPWINPRWQVSDR
jgi:choline dehydrogenase